MFELILGAATLSLAGLYYLVLRLDPIGSIPGPKPILLFGNVVQMVNKAPHRLFNEWSRKYGDVMRVYFFRRPILVVSGLESIYRVLVKQAGDFAGRPYMYRLDVLTDGFSGVVATDAGPEVKARRKLMQSYLKQFGAGMKRIEEVTMTATDDLMTRILATNGSPVKIVEYLFDCTTDIVTIIIHGETVEPSEAAIIQQSMHTLSALVDRNVGGELLDRFPWLRFVGFGLYRQLLEYNQTRTSILQRWFDNKPANGFISYIQSLSEKQRHELGIPEQKHAMVTVMDFLNAGVFTTSNTLGTLINVLAQMSRVQDRLRAEVQEKIGSARTPTLDDREHMPYHNATLLEIGRFASIVALGVPHKATQDTQLGPHKIPAGTYVMLNLWGLHHDEDLWEEPFTFMPERFLDEEGKLVPADHPNRRRLLPFGAGQRVCVGEVFALTRMFLILSRLIQNFVIMPESTVDKQPSMDPRNMKVGIILEPPEFKVRLVPVN